MKHILPAILLIFILILLSGCTNKLDGCVEELNQLEKEMKNAQDIIHFVARVSPVVSWEMTQEDYDRVKDIRDDAGNKLLTAQTVRTAKDVLTKTKLMGYPIDIVAKGCIRLLFRFEQDGNTGCIVCETNGDIYGDNFGAVVEDKPDHAVVDSECWATLFGTKDAAEIQDIAQSESELVDSRAVDSAEVKKDFDRIVDVTNNIDKEAK